MPRIWFFKSLLFIFSFVLTSCGRGAQAPARVRTSSVPAQGSANMTPGTATPTFANITSVATVTPLFRVGIITSKDYGQHLTLFIGDAFLLRRLVGDNGLLTIDNQHALRGVSDQHAMSVTLQAVGIGNARVSSLIVLPCPNAPVGCQPPMDYTYVNVTVVGH